jgi:hypothetical protein
MTTPARIEQTTRYTLPRLRLRQRSSDHPMAMFAMIVTAAFVSMVMTQSSETFASTGGTTEIVDAVRTTEKTSRLPAVSEADRICEGQSWGNETLDCLIVIAKESGVARQIRMIADAGPDGTAPNVF